MSQMNQLSKEDKKMLNSIFLRSFTIFAGRSGGQVRQHAAGFIWVLRPALDRYYKKGTPAHRDALVRHTMFYNITQTLGTFCMGLVASMEKENSENDKFDAHSIVAIKTALMGPLSGIGDSFFWGVLRVIAAGVGISLSLQGSFMGPIMFLLIYNIPSIIIRYYLTFAGYTVGSEFITKINENGLMKVFTKCASIIGLMMIGGMTASSVKFNSIIQFAVEGQDPVTLQSYLDSVFKGLIPISLTLGCLLLMKKGVNANVVLILVLALAIVLALVGVV